MHKCSEIQNLQTELKYLDSLNFYWLLTDFRGPPPWGVGVGGWGWHSVRVFKGVPHAHTHAHTHACIHAYMYKHDNFMQMAAPIGKSWGIPLWHHHSHVCARACICMCTCVGHAWQSPHPPPPPGGWTKSVKSPRYFPPQPTPRPPQPPHPRGVPLICWNVIKLEWIKIIQFCLKIYDL